MNNSANTEKPEIEDITTVIFRRLPKKEGGAVIAIFPYEMADLEGNVQSYMHIGQHGGCSRWFTTFTKPANLEDADVQDLKEELESEPYNYRFKVAKRVNHDRYMQEYWKLRKEYFTPLKTENGQSLKNDDFNKNLLFLQDEITLLVAE